jgi:peroxidase
MYGESALEINPMNTYPWPLVTKAGKPMVVSAEMAIVYRFHEFIIPEFPIKDATNHTLWNQSVFDTGFNPQGFIDAGLENVLRGTVGTHIPNFKSGVDENFRSAGKYRGQPFDVVTWSLVHEREQGLPTFNQYFRAYNKQGRCHVQLCSSSKANVSQILQSLCQFATLLRNSRPTPIPSPSLKASTTLQMMWIL